MKLRSLIYGLAALPMAACVAAPVQTAAAPAPAPTAETKTAEFVPKSKLDPNEEVCERVKTTGSVMPVKVCMTRGQWESQKEQSKDAVNGIQRGNLSSCAAGAGCGGG